ncbi:MAG: hypothetical protein EAZ07_09600 [Cytophagales bacterium]|nr:MAG: hypothetical protein EAZ07_09600 [Cytophagales bacterium]
MLPETNDINHLPLYKKALQIIELTTMLTGTFDKQKDQLNIAGQMLSNAHLIPAKIAGAEAGDLYSLRIENALLIKIAARELMSQTTLCKHLKLANVDYIQLLREEVEQFRVLFLQWARGFDKQKDASDEWTI